MSKFTGSVQVKVKRGMKVRVNPDELVGRMHEGKIFTIDSEPRDLCGTEVVALNNADGSRFSAAYELSMLQVTDAT